MKNTELLEKIKNSKTAVLGFGISNEPLVQFLLDLGVKDITVHDKKNLDDLGDKALEYNLQGVNFIGGEHYLDSIDAEVIFRTPGIRDDIPAIVEAVEKGAWLTSEMELFLELTPARVIAITGSDGKTTTTTLTHMILETELASKGKNKVYVGGNIGKPLLPLVSEMSEEDFVVVELSSFQLKTMKYTPYRAAITNISPNHLDWHTDMAEYSACKFNLCRGAKLDRLVTNAECEATFSYADSFETAVTVVSSKKTDFHDIYEERHGRKAIFERDGEVILSDGTLERMMAKTADIKLVGRHNLENYMTAIALLDGLVSYNSIRKVATNFGGVEHRLEFVRELDGVKYYNSSIDSSPTRTIAAISAFGELKPIVICGGYDKHIPFDELGHVLCRRAKAIVLTGATREAINASVRRSEYFAESNLTILIKPDFTEAVETARKISCGGDVVLLSPACASFDAFKNFEERGATFKNIVNSMV